ncbi:WYL domain-containing protein [Psychrobium sp. 1_MG-2023]|uniref:WYL domain-containing protein n=1 Tax=Psychrobium sp. 1_MG-2023 TaxID=3062624 RepID=UPI000C32ECF8|nr:WYL domain-containing protein [Psychrobium sp. 1_MG-2023]MDP2561420.1 WYL domain-containing protein [Psychrobium sp. 1_MG-2023]PKF54900.1 WYL domain-containing protein [Alteromonadales bacterium alter-6D02]
MIDLKHLPSQQVSRLRYIEFCLRFLGSFTRADLIKKFGIGTAAASRDIAEYKNLMPNNISDSSNSKNYFLSEDWKELFKFKSSEVLAQLTGNEIQANTKSYISSEVIDIIDEPNIEVVTATTKGILQRAPIKCEYFSNSSGASEKILIPHSYMFNGSRWHLRAYDRTKGRFADFVISRFRSAHTIEEPVLPKEFQNEDVQWNRQVDLEIIPHPSLKDPSGVLNEFNMTDGILRKRVRASSVGYLLQKLYVDCSKDPIVEEHYFRLKLKNRLALYGVEGLHLTPNFDGFND